MSLFGKFIAYCANCGTALETNCSGQGMWRSYGRWMVCGKDCHDKMDMKHTRSILGKDDLIEIGRITTEDGSTILVTEKE